MAEMTIAPVATHGFFIDGKWVEDGEIVEVRAPYDGAVVGRVFRGRREHAEAAIAAAVITPALETLGVDGLEAVVVHQHIGHDLGNQLRCDSGIEHGGLRWYCGDLDHKLECDLDSGGGSGGSHDG